MRKFLRENRVELIALLVILFGIFLLIEPFEIRESLWKGLRWLSDTLTWLADVGARQVVGYFKSFTISDLLGWILLISASIFFAWRIRVRFLHSETWRARACPKCGSRLHRVHRSRFDILLGRSLLPHSRRYQCENADCGWSGLRYHDYKKHRTALDESIGVSQE